MNATSFVKKYFITASSIEVDENPNNKDWKGANHYIVTLAFQQKDADGLNRIKRLTVPYSMGSALTGKPKAAEVLDCLMSDYGTTEYAESFEDWCNELGYDPDSRTAETTYNTIVKQSKKLKEFLGEDLFNELYEAERL